MIDNGVPHPKDYAGAMPPKGGAALSEADIDRVAAYVWALGHSGREEVRRSHRSVVKDFARNAKVDVSVCVDIYPSLAKRMKKNH